MSLYPEPFDQAENDFVPQEWLRESISVKQAESDNMLDGVPFGFLHTTWVRLREKMVEGDELRRFCSPEDSWEDLAGQAGIALIRNGKAVDGIITLMN